MRPSTTTRSPRPSGRRGRRGRTLGATRVVAAAAGCLLLAGCFTLSPVRMDREIPPGRIRVHLSDAGASRVAGALGGPASVVDGRLTGSTGDEIVLLVPSTGQAGFGGEVLYQELHLPKDEVEALQRRKLDRMRTGLAVGGVAAVSGFLLYRSLSGKTGGSPDGGSGGPTEARVPLFQLWWP